MGGPELVDVGGIVVGCVVFGFRFPYGVEMAARFRRGIPAAPFCAGRALR